MKCLVLSGYGLGFGLCGHAWISTLTVRQKLVFTGVGFMNDLELIFSMLGEAATTGITRTKDALGFPESKVAAVEGDNVAGNARRELEKKSVRKVVSRENHFDAPESVKRLKRDGKG